MNTLIAWLNDTGPVFCRHAVWMLIQTGILFAILWTLDRLLRKRIKASLRYGLWLLILIKLLLPVDFRLPSGIGYWVPAETVQKAVSAVPLVQSARPDAPRPPAVNVPISPPEAPVVSEFDGRSEPMRIASAPASVSLTLPGLLLGLWMLGVAALAAALLYQILYVRRIVRRSRPVPPAVSQALRHCQSQVACQRTIVIRQSDDMPSPAVCGLWRPAILLPSSLVDNLSPEQLRAVLLHELGHIQRHDLWVNVFQTTLQVCYFYNPFVRLANHWIRRTREQANDEHVLVHLDGSRQNYGSTLIEIAAAALARPALAMRMIGVAEPKTQLHERITLIMKKPLPKNSKTGALDIAALIVMALLLLPMAAGPRARAEASAPETPLTQEQVIHQEKKLVANMIRSFNDQDIDGFVSAYADDAILLPDQSQIAVATLGLKMAFMPEFNQGVKVLKHDYVYHELWSCGRYVMAATQDRLAAQLPSMPQMLTVLRNYLTIYQVQPDGTLKIKIEAVNMGDPATLADLPETPAETLFHQVESDPPATGAMHEGVENVKKLDSEFHRCFDRQDQQAALEYYTDDAMLMTVNQDPIRGRQAIAAHFADSMTQTELVNNNHQIIHAEGNDQMVILVNQFGWVFKDLATGETVSVPGKGIHVWQKQPDGGWKIRLDIHNTNIPLGG